MKTRFNWRKYLQIGLLLVIGSLAIWAMFFGKFPVFQYDRSEINQLQKRYGFTYATPVYQRVKCRMELITVMLVTPGGAFEKAGIEPGDVFPNGPTHSTDDLFHQLDKAAGTIIEMEVLPGHSFKPDCDFDGTGKTVIRKIVAP
jgi:hypothetical protein